MHKVVTAADTSGRRLSGLLSLQDSMFHLERSFRVEFNYTPAQVGEHRSALHRAWIDLRPRRRCCQRRTASTATATAGAVRTKPSLPASSSAAASAAVTGSSKAVDLDHRRRGAHPVARRAVVI